MDQKIIDKLKNIPHATCAKCKRKRSHTNPMARCDECGKKFCYDHIQCMQFKDGMRESDELRDICDDCKQLHGYRNF